MSLKPVHIVQQPYLYPVGNTPAVCFTDTLPPEIDAKVLLLGCGDIRSVLFTLYSSLGSDYRKFDFTCCDLEAEIIARNIVALTLIADDKNGTHIQHTWNLYYHVLIDQPSEYLLHAHVKSLLARAETLKTWNEGPYANSIGFCDEATFDAVVKLWKLYATDPSSGQDYKNIQTLLKDQWKVAQCHKDQRVANGMIMNGLRAYAPILSGEALAEVNELHHTFWKTGFCFSQKKLASQSTISNPMFGCLRSHLILHYGLNPLNSFHLAPTHTRLAAGSPLSPMAAKTIWGPSTSGVLQIAFEQFSAWCNAFRGKADRVTIRFANADAIAFCHVLQHQKTHDRTNDVFWYRNSWNFEQVVLDQAMYARGDSAPVTFNVIDTSNLIDHLGSLNILTATSPLLEQSPTSTLRTEMLLPRESNVADSVKTLLCGELPTVAALLGLRPIQYWTNTTDTRSFNETSLRNVPGGYESLGQINRPIVLWKLLDLSRVEYDADELARFVYNIYLEMFSDESFANRFSMLGIQNKDFIQKKISAFGVYTRASLAALLQHVKLSGVVDWRNFTQKLVVSLIYNDRHLNMRPHHIQSFCVYLHMMSLVQLDQLFDWWHPRSFSEDLQGPFRSWEDIPPVVCVTMVVPRERVLMFSDISKGNGTPVCQIQMRSSYSGEESNYPDVQMGFGTVVASGKAFTNDYCVAVSMDTEGWKGRSPLVVSAMVSTCSLVQYGDTAARVAFVLKGTPNTIATLSSKLGIFLQLFESAIGKKDVFITRYAPNMTGYISIGSLTAPKSSFGGLANVTIKPMLTFTRVASIQVRYDVTSAAAKTLLQSDASVDVQQCGLFELRLTTTKCNAIYERRKEKCLSEELHKANIEAIHLDKLATRTWWVRDTVYSCTPTGRRTPPAIEQN